MQTLTNGVLTVEINEVGAELWSIRKGETEYLWHGEPEYWNRRSPVLFPIVGSVWEARYRVDGKEYTMGQHGFARDMEFEVVAKTGDSIRFRLESSEETLKAYPYPFTLEIGYRLEGSGIEVSWEVGNPADKDMHFQIGAHPAFLYPDYGKLEKGRGYFTFDRCGGLECVGLAGKGCADATKRYPLPLSDGRLKLNSDTFDDIDTFVLQDSQVKKVAMFCEDGTPWLSVTFDAPVLGLWSPPGKNAPFVCIEPWFGRCDRAGFEGEFKDRDWMNSLASGERFNASYRIEIA